MVYVHFPRNEWGENEKYVAAQAEVGKWQTQTNEKRETPHSLIIIEHQGWHNILVGLESYKTREINKSSDSHSRSGVFKTRLIVHKSKKKKLIKIQFGYQQFNELYVLPWTNDQLK